MIEFLITLALILIPLYICNSAPLLFGGGTPIDRGRFYKDGLPLLGEGKTFRGAISGIVLGTLAAFAIVYVFGEASNAFIPNYLFYGFLLSLGAVLGDIIKSFFKRRLNIKAGQPWFLVDQLDFVIGGIALGSLIFVVGLWEFFFIALFTIVMHKLANFIAYKIKLKRVPW